MNLVRNTFRYLLCCMLVVGCMLVARQHELHRQGAYVRAAQQKASLKAAKETRQMLKSSPEEGLARLLVGTIR